MEDHHKEAIRSNLALLCRDVDYARLRPEMLKHRLFPERQLRLLEERAGAGQGGGGGGQGVKLEVFLQVQRRGPTAFRWIKTDICTAGCWIDSN